MRNVWAVISDFWMQYLSTCKEIFEIFWNSRGHICEIFGKHTPSQLAGCWQEYIWTFACCDITWQSRAESIPYQHRWICLHSEAFKASGRMSLIVLPLIWYTKLSKCCFERDRFSSDVSRALIFVIVPLIPRLEKSIDFTPPHCPDESNHSVITQRYWIYVSSHLKTWSILSMWKYQA